MNDFLSRAEFEDQFRLLTAKIDRAVEGGRRVAEEVDELVVREELSGHLIRELQRWVVPLLSAEQRELLGVESRAGVGPPVELQVETAAVETTPDLVAQDPEFAHKWKCGDLCYVVFQEFGDLNATRCWNVFVSEVEALAFGLACESKYAANDCDAPLVECKLCQVTGVDFLGNEVTEFAQHGIVI